ncbi:Neuroparsin [Trinorchestia longiramus]|nr:Neuroparsin [Trinorchestia longiramus]
MAATNTCRSSNVFISGLLLAALALLCIQPASGAPSCQGRSSSTVVSEDNCINGVVYDWCHQPACGKGPGEPCGGRWNENGECGKGMFCACGVCHGCNRRLDCHFNVKC